MLNKKLFSIGGAFILLQSFCVLLLLLLTAAPAIAQENGNPSEQKAQPVKNKPRRVSNVKIKDEPPSAETVVVAKSGATTAAPEVVNGASSNEKDEAETDRLENERSERMRAEKERLEKERIEAGLAALEREKQRAAEEAVAKERASAAERERFLKEQMDAEIKKREDALKKERQEAAENTAKITSAAQAEKRRLETEAAAKQREAEELRRQANELTGKVESSEKAKAELEAKALETEKQANQAKIDAARNQAEIERRAAEEKEKVRVALIAQTARNLSFLKPDEATALVPANLSTGVEIETALKAAIKKSPALVRAVGFCSSGFEGANYTLDIPGEVTMEVLLNDLRSRYGINFLPDSDVMNLPVRVNVQDIPWNIVLRSKLNNHNLVPVCAPDGKTIEIYKREKYLALQDAERKSEPLVTEFIELQYLQPQKGGQVNVAGKPLSSGSGSVESLVADIDKVLKEGGNQRGSVSRITGTNKLIVEATERQFERIRAIVKEADKKPVQVILKAYVYSANATLINDKGFQGSVIFGAGNLNQLGGFSTLPGNSQAGGSSSGGGGSSGGSSSGGASNEPGQVVPGGVRNLGPGFGQPSNALSAGAPNSVFGISSIIGTAQFSLQLTSLHQQGKVFVKSTPFGIVLNGNTINLDVGRQVPVLIEAQNNLGGGGGTLEILNAGNILVATPQVIYENGRPTAVNLNLRLENNDVDPSVTTRGVPSVNRRSIQNDFILGLNQTVVLGGFTVESEANTKSKSLFGVFQRNSKTRSQDRLFFAIQAEVVEQGADASSVKLPENYNTEIPTNVPDLSKKPRSDSPQSPK